jgi:hypothetical protein
MDSLCAPEHIVSPAQDDATIVLSYGLYDAFGRKALYVGAPITALIIHFALPSA